MRLRDRSKPMVRRSLPNAVATGRPTQPRPTTATVGRAALAACRWPGTGVDWGGNSRMSDMGEARLPCGREILDVPVDRLGEARAPGEGRPIAEQPRRLANVGARQKHVAAPRRAVNRAHVAQVRQPLGELVTHDLEQLVQRGLLAYRDVVGLAESLRILDRGGEQVRLPHVVA